MGRYLDKAKKLEAERPKTHQEWLSAWRELTQITYGITAEDPRFEPVMRWLNICDIAFAMDSWASFQDAAAEVKRWAAVNVKSARDIQRGGVT